MTENRQVRDSTYLVDFELSETDKQRQQQSYYPIREFVLSVIKYALSIDHWVE